MTSSIVLTTLKRILTKTVLKAFEIRKCPIPRKSVNSFKVLLWLRAAMSIFLSDTVPDLLDTDPNCSTSNVALTAFFLRSIVTPRRLQTVTGVFEELPFFFLKTNGTQSSLQYITLACASAAYGIRHSSASALALARSTYDTAITQLSEDILAFSDCSAPGTAILNVVLCNFYEFMTCLKNNRPFRNIHEQGLISLIRSCGTRSSFTDSADGRLVEAARHYIANDCLESGSSASEALGQATPTLNLTDDDFCRLLTRCVIRAADAATATSRPNSRSTQEELLVGLERVQDIEKDLQQWVRCIPVHWKFSNHRDLSWPAEYAFDNRCDFYYDLQVAANWNCYRRVRLILLEIIIDSVDLLSFSDGDNFNKLRHDSLAAMEQMSEDICASVPFHMGTRGSTSDPVLFPSSPDKEGDAIRNQTAPILGWFFVILPIQRLMKIKGIPDAHRNWIIMQHRRVCSLVGEKHGISEDSTASILETAIPAFASALPINSRHIRLSQEITKPAEPRLNLQSETSSLRVQAPMYTSTDSTAEPRCWKHGCHGRRFANWSNLERHCKERDKAKWTCSRCGASFTRRSAQRTHMQLDRCGSINGRPRANRASVE